MKRDYRVPVAVQMAADVLDMRHKLEQPPNCQRSYRISGLTTMTPGYNMVVFPGCIPKPYTGQRQEADTQFLPPSRKLK